MLQQSGLSSDQVRDLLEERGYSRTAADPYLSVLEGVEEQVPGTATPVPLLEALTDTDLAASLAGDSLPSELVSALQRLDALRLAEEEEEGPPVFGREIFLRTRNNFV